MSNSVNLQNLITSSVFTEDKTEIAYNQYKTGHKEVLILAPGWFMTKDSEAFSKISEDFSSYFDVIIFDFRGHGKSHGKYTFGAKETQDLSQIVEFAKNNYEKVYLMGFSLGALISIDYCAKNHNIDKLVLVSAPADFNKIENNVFDPNAFIPTLKKFEFDRWTSIRFELPFFSKKPIPIDIIQEISPTPVFFLAGEKDPIINSWHNAELFKKANSPKKEFVIKDGWHAEDLYLKHKELFMELCLNWLKKGE